MDVHIGLEHPSKYSVYRLGRCEFPELDLSSQFTADDDYEVPYTYRDDIEADGRALFLAEKSEEGDKYGHHRVKPKIVEVATQDIHAVSDSHEVYAGGYTKDEGGTGDRHQMRSVVCHHTSGGDKDMQTYYTDGFFFGDAIVYNEHLASASYGLAMSGAYMDGYEYAYKHAGARQYMADIGCPDQMIYVNDSNCSVPGTDAIGVTIGSKVLQTMDDGGSLTNTDYVLIAVGMRGANYEKEWAGNVRLGDGAKKDGEAQGFSAAADQVTDAIEYYIGRFGLREKVKAGKVKFWVSGFSRAGATSNICGKRLIERYCERTKASVAVGNEVFCYPLEAPKGGTDKAELLEDETACFRIHNVVHAGDVVPLVAPGEMGFKRYGVDHYVPGTRVGTTERDEYLKQVEKDSVKPKRASPESGVTSVTTYRDNEHLDTKKDMDGNITESYDAYQRRRDKMVTHLAMIDHTLLFDDYFHPWATDVTASDYFSKIGKFNGAKVEDFLANLLPFLQQEACYRWDNFATVPVRVNGRDYDTLQHFAREYLSTSGKAKKKFDDLLTAFNKLLNEGWFTALKNVGDYYSLSGQDKEDLINKFWKMADDDGVSTA